ncbi:MAG: hypothetical protein FJ109_10015 [Deltaproteobacteria bacterium]|nr:hypothetical protein [Deltaproteobacteria bacterium]
MSGLKCSEYTLEARRERVARLKNQIERTASQAMSFQQEVSRYLAEASEGLRSTFAAETEEAREWLKRVEVIGREKKSWLMSDNEADLHSRQSLASELSAGGQSVRAHLAEAYVSKAGRMRKGLSCALADVRSQVAASAALVEKWLGPDRLSRLSSGADAVAATMKSDQLALAEGQLAALTRDLEDACRVVEQREQLDRLGMLRRELERQEVAVRNLLESTSAGLRETFSEAVRQAEGCLAAIVDARRGVATVGGDARMDAITSACAALEARVKESAEVVAAVRRTLVEESAQMRGRLSPILSSLDSDLAQWEERLGHWKGREWIDGLGRRLSELRASLEADRLGTVESQVQSARGELDAALDHASGQELKHQRRVQLLNALRQVCAEFGFAEVAQPRHEEGRGRQGRIVFSVNTFNRGLITFHLSLDTIEAEAGILASHCMDDFDKLSRMLDEKFGVRTKFKVVEGDPGPVIVRKGELEEPGDPGKSREEGA